MENISISIFKDVVFKDDPEMQRLFYYLEYDINSIYFYYGRHFKSPREKDNKTGRLKNWLQQMAIDQFYKYQALKSKKSNKKIVLSSAYYGINQTLSDEQYHFMQCPWYVERHPPFVDYPFYKKTMDIRKILIKGSFKDLVNREFLQIVQDYKKDFIAYIQKYGIVALIVAQETGFFEKLAIDIFKDLKLPTFNVIHGLPGYYNKHTYDKSDYFCVWGEKRKESFIKNGIKESKILITGHPNYKVSKTQLKSGKQDILVLSKSMNGSQFDNDYHLQDRSRSIYFIEAIKLALKQVGVNHARLRLHPSENDNWYETFNYDGFYHLDKDDLSNSLAKSTLVIGPTSTVFVDAISSGVNFICFEPTIGSGETLNGFPLVPPFDGTESGIPIAFNAAQLQNLLQENTCVNDESISKYLSSNSNFNIIKEKIRITV